MPLVDDLADLIEHDRAEARRLLLDMAAAMPASVEARVLLAASFLRSLEYEAAAETYRALLALNPVSNVALHGLAFCRLAQGDNEGALDAYQRALAATSSANSMVVSALIQHRLGRFEAAARGYEAVLKGAQPTSIEIIQAQRAAMLLMRDTGRAAEADRYAAELNRQFQAAPLTVSSRLVDRSHAMAFHEWMGLVDKAGLARILQNGAAHDPTRLRVPPTFILPDQRAELVRFAAAEPEGALFIVKPTRGSGGQGISVVADLAPVLDRQDVIVQRYVERPYLADGRKGHLRIYALITAPQPLRAYVYSEGIVRFAPEPYDLRPERLSEVAMHVTNTALHVGHPGLTISEDPSRDDVGAIWSLSALFRRMAADGHDVTAVFGEIQALVAGFLRLLRDDGFFARQAARGPARAYASKLFGLDILLDDAGHPWLLEIQTSPAAIGAPLVGRINGELFNTIFRMTVGPLGLGETADAEAIARRELEIEQANRGLFVPLDLRE